MSTVLAALGGTLARWYMLQRDYRQYPSYPQGWAIHLFLGFIGGTIGAVIVPAFLEREFAAVSFLLLAASQFREVRNVERATLQALEQTELVKRGSAYIEGIARVFEARNYLAILVSLAMSISWEIFAGLGQLKAVLSILVGVSCSVLLNRLMRGDQLGQIASVELRPIEFESSLLIVEDTKIINVGLQAVRQVYKKRGLAAVIKPKGPDEKATLANFGQMQAIAHDVTTMVGVYMDVGEQLFTPIVRRNPATGHLYLVMVPSEAEGAPFIAAIKHVPVLESAIRKPLSSKAGRMMD